MDALWNDDFHHSARVALTGRNEAYYTDFRGTPQELVSAAKRGFLFQGQWFSWQKNARGTPAQDLAPEQFVTFLENHDQVANSLHGARLNQLSSPGGLRAMTGLLLLGPGTPMLFQGQEFAASAPFLFFADHHPELAQLVVRGRREFLRQFPSVAHPESDPYLASPAELETFQRCKLDFSERQKHARIYRLHQDLLRLRREDPVFARPQPGRVDGAVLAPEALALRFFGETGDDRLLLLNLGVDLKLAQAPEPLLAPVENASWRVLWSSESTVYGGSGTPEIYLDGVWRIPGQCTVVLAPYSS
jgi:maltooligosyltrehalose trehalohydrolase